MFESFSVVIPSYSRTDLLARCLHSLRTHAGRDLDVVVVDDASADGKVSRTAHSFPGVRVVRMPRRSGFCKAVNAGIAVVGRPVVELLNDDTEVTAGWAEAALPWFRDERVAAVAPLVVNPTRRGEVVDSAGDWYYVGGVAGKRGHGRPLGDEPLRAGPVFGASASSAFYRRDLLLRVGGFPEHFGAYFEDVDLSFRLRHAGGQIVFEPRSRVRHLGSASYGRTGWRLIEQQSRNEERVYWRNLPTPLLRRSLGLHLAVLAGKALRRWDEGTFVPFLLGRLRLLAETGDILRHRRWLRQLSHSREPTDWPLENRFHYPGVVLE